MKRTLLKKIIVTGLALMLLIPQRATYVGAEENSSSGIFTGETPDFYGNVEYISGGNFYIVYLKENTKENRENILASIAQGTVVVFASCDYSEKELQVVQEDITSKKSNYPGLVAWGIGTTNLPSGAREPRLVVHVLHENYEETSKKLAEQYGNKVVTVPSGPIDLEVPSIPAPGPTVTSDVKFKSVKLANKKLQVKWKKYKYAKKYKICIVKNNGKKLVAKTTKKTSFTYKIKGKVAKSYTVKVKAYNKNSKGWGVWTTTSVNRK